MSYRIGPRPQPSTPDTPAQGRFNKPGALSASAPLTGAALTFHHKLNYTKLMEVLARAIAARDGATLAKLAAFARVGVVPPAITAAFVTNDPTPDTIQEADMVALNAFAAQLAWVPWNGFFGPAPEDRLDDPGHEPDSHYAADGTRTPRSELAHEVGGGFGLDLVTLTDRLNALANNASAYQAADWGYTGGVLFQSGNPNPEFRVTILTSALSRTLRNGVQTTPAVDTPLGHDGLPRAFRIKVVGNNAVTGVQMAWAGGGPGRGVIALAGNHVWTCDVTAADRDATYQLTVTAQSLRGNKSKVLILNISPERTQHEIDVVTAERQKAAKDARDNPVEADYDFAGMW